MAINISTVVHPTPITVLTSSTPVVSANTARRYLLLVNDSDTIIYINLGGTAALNTGIRLNANGGSHEMAAGFGNLFQGAITAISSATPKLLLVTEGN